MVLHFLNIFICVRGADARHHHLCFADKDIFLGTHHLIDFGNVFDVAACILRELRVCLYVYFVMLCL